MLENEEKRDEQEVKKDDLMWSEEDYDAMQKLTGFDEESIENDQKKGINLLVFVIVCIVCLIIGFLVGFNVNKREPVNNSYITHEVNNFSIINSIYTRLNESNELYLYVLNNSNEEFSILNLTNSKYDFQLIDEKLYVLLEEDELKLYVYSFNNSGYHRDLVKSFNKDYSAFYLKNGLVLIKYNDYLDLYDKEAKFIRKISFSENEILDYTLDYIIYEKNNELNIYDIYKEDNRNIAKNLDSLLYIDGDKIFYIEANKLISFNFSTNKKEELRDISLNSVFIKVNNYYLFNDGKDLYIFDKSIKKIKEFEYNINEFAYINQNNIVIILDDYDSNNCLLMEKKFGIFNISSKSLTTRNINGCLNTQVINDLIVVN